MYTSHVHVKLPQGGGADLRVLLRVNLKPSEDFVGGTNLRTNDSLPDFIPNCAS